MIRTVPKEATVTCVAVRIDAERHEAASHNVKGVQLHVIKDDAGCVHVLLHSTVLVCVREQSKLHNYLLIFAVVV